MLVALAATVGFLALAAAARESEYRRLITKGEQALRDEEIFVAIEAFSGALALKADSMPAYLRLGEAYRRQGELGTALRHLREAARLDPGAPRPHELLGDVNYAMSRYARAVESYQTCLEIDDRSAQVQYKLALSLYKRGDPVAAVAPLTAAIVLEPAFAEAHYLLALCYADAGRTSEAIAEAEEAVRLSPAIVAPRELLATLYSKEGNDRGASEVLQALAALEPERPERLVSAARVLARMGRTDLAVITLGHAAERHPNDPQVFFELGRTWFNVADSRGDRVALKKAIEALERAARGPSATSEGLTLLGRALMTAGDQAEALRVLQQATARFPIEASAFVHLASAAGRMSRPELARDALVRYLALVPGSEAAGRLAPQIAEYSLRAGDAAGAVQWFQRGLELNGETASGLARLAEAQLRAGKSDAARETVRRGLHRDSRHAGLLALRRRLGA